MSKERQAGLQNEGTAPKRFLDIDGAEIYTSIKKSTLHKLSASREIPHIKLGNKLYFDTVALDAWMTEKAVSTNDEIKAAVRA